MTRTPSPSSGTPPTEPISPAPETVRGFSYPKTGHGNTHRLHQTYRVERSIVIDVEAVSTAAACEALASGDIAIPAFDDPRRCEVRSLEHEDYRPA